MTQNQVQTWLRELGCRSRTANNPGVEWMLSHIEFPVGSGHLMGIGSPLPPQQIIMVGSDTKLDGPMLRELRALGAQRQGQCVEEFRAAVLGRPGMNIDPVLDPPHITPAGFMIFTYARDQDLLSAEVLRRVMTSVYEAYQAGWQALSRYLPPMPPAPSAIQ